MAGLPRTVINPPGGGGDLVEVAVRSDGTAVHRVDRRGAASYFVKTTPLRDENDLRFHPPSEAERLVWLGGQGFPVPEVIDVGADGDTMWLVTTAVEGRPAADWPDPAERPAVLGAVADFTRALHALPVEECPFDRGLGISLRWARTAARTGRIDLDDLDEDHSGWSEQRLLDELEAAEPPPEDEQVVCHGDLCLDNVLINPTTLAVSGVLDVGRLGRADRWVDLAIALRDIDEERPGGGDAGAFVRRYGLTGVDERRFRYYRLLDEFF
ncbi:APH(3') family aminoglycoside O-phosphotransferase [Streptomyces sp. NPDC094448]|uniref:APH(3') family aminoglycoside O-phosphotransferase n=1 Tax=Streptomyces sp. NPDC094448 TaxID=3366063 RepID=UPI0037FE5D30